MTRAQQVVEEVFGLYQQYGTDDYIGEPVSQIEHMSQAAQLALNEGCDDEVVLAAFFHDIGHFCVNDAKNMDGYGVIDAIRKGDIDNQVPILVLTTESGDKLKQRARQAGATGWIVKPFDDVSLVSVIRRVTGIG